MYEEDVWVLTIYPLGSTVAGAWSEFPQHDHDIKCNKQLRITRLRDAYGSYCSNTRIVVYSTGWAIRNLLPPSDQDMIRFFQRAIAKHGLLQQYTDGSNKETGDEIEEEKKKKEEVKVHSLALASARLQPDGIFELNRAINLNTLVVSGEYYGLTNVVGPSLEISATSAPSEQKSSEETDTKKEQHRESPKVPWKGKRSGSQ